MFAFFTLFRVFPNALCVVQARVASELMDVPGLLVSVAGTSECRFVKSDCYVSLEG